MKDKIRLLILSDNKILREELVRYLAPFAEIEMTGAFPLKWDAVKIISQHKPSLVLLSIPDVVVSDFKTLIGQIANLKSANLLGLISNRAPGGVAELLLSGINGFILEERWQASLRRSMHIVHKQGIAIPPQLARGVIDFLRNPVVPEKSKKLTEKELQVLSEIRKGLSYREVANNFNIGESTIRTHCKSIYKKLGVRGRIEAINMVFLNPGLATTPLNLAG